MPVSSSFIKQPVKVVNKASKLLKTAYLNRTARIHPEPIVILGNPKSGTTAIASLLGKATGKEVIIDPFYRIENSVNLRQKIQTKELTFRDFIQKHKYYFAPEIIKDPYLIFIYEEFLECFPQAKVIYISREPRDNIRSILNRLKIPGNLEVLDSCYLDELPHKSAWKLVLEGQFPLVPGNNYIE
ncbi:sulfotransferase [Myxosarcina sp. GI1(2024)]